MSPPRDVLTSFSSERSKVPEAPAGARVDSDGRTGPVDSPECARDAAAPSGRNAPGWAGRHDEPEPEVLELRESPKGESWEFRDGRADCDWGRGRYGQGEK